MLRGNTKKQLTYSPQSQLAYFHRKKFSYYPEKKYTYYPQKKVSYYPEKKYTYYHLIAVFITGLIGGWTINNLDHNYHYQSLLDSPALESAKLKTPAVVKVPAFMIKIDKQTAFNSVWNLPQVQRKAKEIESLSQGSIRVSALVESSPTTDRPFYIVRVFENHPDKTTSPVYWFKVSSFSGVIEPLDLVENEYIALEKWNPDGR
ncbi:hypothetical protein [Sphaerospermopsis torques-reginae]|uniref:hypothetical protein n=1 Tax=Sphaerospermopsis torques-reginae TaxID=984207 RepID=UPI001FEA70EF|nr:hypothetical protein [Sphaerospermopsis torques-reginae]